MKPYVKKYLDVFLFLQDSYQYRKNQDLTFSYDVWAKELGISDKSYVRFIVIGKRPINEKMTESLAHNLKLSDEDKKYFLTLVDYTQSKTRVQKELFGQKLISFLKSELDQIEIQAHYEFLSNPLLPRLQVFLSFHDLDQSSKNLSWLLGTSEEEIISGLRQLENLKLIQKSKDRFVPIKKAFKVSDNFGDIGLEAFYKSNLDAAQAAISLPKSERRFKSLFLPLNAEEFEAFLTNMDTFTKEQLFKFNPDEYADRRLYQVHFNIIPVSQKSESQIDVESVSEV